MKYRYLIFFSLLPVFFCCQYEHDCQECSTCVNNTCVNFNQGELCLPDNAKELEDDLKLYYDFYYQRHVQIEEYRCNDFGISLKFYLGLNIKLSINRTSFEKNYKHLLLRDCDNWSFFGL